MKQKFFTRLVLLAVLAAVLLGMPVFAKTKTVKMKKKGLSYSYTGKFKGEKYIYHRVKIKKTGVLRVTGYQLTKKKNKLGMRITLLDSNKKRLDVNKKNVINYKKKSIQYYTLSKGTYYIRLNGKSLKKNSTYVMQAKLTDLSDYLDHAGTMRDYARTLEAKTARYAVFTATDPQGCSRWMKFSVDGDEIVELALVPQLKNSNEGSFKAYLFGPSFDDEEKFPDGKELKISKKGDRYMLSVTLISRTLNGAVRKIAGLKKGDYYLRICRDNSDAYNAKFGSGYVKVIRRSHTAEEYEEMKKNGTLK